MNNINLKIKYLDNYPKNCPPIKYQKEFDAGFDLIAAIDNKIIINRQSMCVISNGISVEIPEGFQIEIRSRSGLAAKHSVFTLNSPGTVDSGFRGAIQTILMNLGNEYFVVNPGDRISQGVVMPTFRANFIVVDELSTSDRGMGGFGSTGVK